MQAKNTQSLEALALTAVRAEAAAERALERGEWEAAERAALEASLASLRAGQWREVQAARAVRSQLAARRAAERRDTEEAEAMQRLAAFAARRAAEPAQEGLRRQLRDQADAATGTARAAWRRIAASVR